MFPALAEYYTHLNPDDPCLKFVFGLIQYFIKMGGAGQIFPIVLFGGILGALYSFLQFLSAPFWGSLSDKIGRRPVFIMTVTGLTLSYVLWVFSGSFTLLFVSRMMAGLMGGKISVATAIVADITDKETRSKGMALVGMTFGLGFIVGPALGGLTSMVDLTKYFPGLISWGINPFSVPALVAAILSLYNLVLILRSYQETLIPEKRNPNTKLRIGNPMILFNSLPYAGVNLTNFSYFLFLIAYGGMEFTLTFLAAERLSFSSMDNACLFIYAGFLIALIQGGVVRRYAHIMGEKKMALMGLVFLIPGFALMGQVTSSSMLYFSLTLISFGGAFSIPCFI
jgi:MFS family permease